MKVLFSTALFLLTLVPTLTMAQNKPVIGSQDVCCFGYSGDGKTITTFAQPLSASSCKAGSKDPQSGRTICGANPSVDACASLSSEAICSQCGFHWIKDVSACSEKELVEPKKDTTKN
jgi:hypothetical protein